MNAKKILFPTDFSTAAEAGLAEAESLARARGAKLIILHVQEPIMGYDGPLDYGPIEATGELLKKMLRDVTPTDRTVCVEPRLTMGDPATEIIRVANEENVDMIVMGTHGRTGLSRFFMGSVAEQVIRHAACPVLTYRARKQPVSGRIAAGGAMHYSRPMSALAR
jgi:universal stress protein A